MKCLRFSAQLQHFTGISFHWQDYYNLLYDVTENKVNTLCSIALVNTMLQKNVSFSQTLNNYSAPQHFVQHIITDHLSATLM